MLFEQINTVLKVLDLELSFAGGCRQTLQTLAELTRVPMSYLKDCVHLQLRAWTCLRTRVHALQGKAQQLVVVLDDSAARWLGTNRTTLLENLRTQRQLALFRYFDHPVTQQNYQELVQRN